MSPRNGLGDNDMQDTGNPSKTTRAAGAATGINRAEFLRLFGGLTLFAATTTVAGGRFAAALAAGAGTLTVGISSDIKTLDPQMSTLDVFRHTIRSTVFESLVFIDPDTLQADPMLAEAWTLSDDGLELTFTIREGVTWHDGSPFTAGDVVYSIKRAKDPEVGSPFSAQLEPVTDVVAVDDRTVKVTLAATTPGILSNLAVVAIVKESNIADIGTAPIGTGPFTFVNWTPGDHIRVERYDSYYRAEQPELAAVEWRIVPDSQARLAGLQDGSLQLLALVEAKDVKQAETFADVQVLTTKPYILYENFNINTKRAPFDDKRVRQALAHAFDREAYTKAVWFGLARPTINPVPEEMETYLPDSSSRYPFDLAKTEALLAEAGFSKDKPLKMEILTIAGFDSLKSMALLLQDNLNRLGHDVTVRDLDVTVWIDRIVTNPDFDITTDNFNTGPEDAASMFNSPNFAPTSNVNQWNPPGYAELLAKAVSENDKDKRIALYRELQELVLDEMPQITVDHLPLFFLATGGVEGLVIGPSGIDDYGQVTVEGS
ncbi:MAG: ABC transporter substrate-binding protein [Bauldia litoralis]|uniref:ABC transporter substrate-binding protein n=2 Tax=Bauldia litoralis TaxID=665467 RepID=UPI003298618B